MSSFAETHAPKPKRALEEIFTDIGNFPLDKPSGETFDRNKKYEGDTFKEVLVDFATHTDSRGWFKELNKTLDALTKFTAHPKLIPNGPERLALQKSLEVVDCFIRQNQEALVEPPKVEPPKRLPKAEIQALPENERRRYIAETLAAVGIDMFCRLTPEQRAFYENSIENFRQMQPLIREMADTLGISLTTPNQPSK